MEWFEKHLNWTWAFSWLLMQIISLTSYVLTISANETSISGAIIILVSFLLSIFSIIFWLVVSGWVIKQKGESLWWILLSGWWSPVWLRNIRTMAKEQMALIHDK